MEWGEMNNQNLDINWHDIPDAESRLELLRKRDVEVAEISRGLQMRARINHLEAENAQLRSMESIWLTNRIGRLYFAVPRRFLKFFRRMISGK
jgi:hypothetical protein